MKVNVNYRILDALIFQTGLSRRKLAAKIGVSPDTLAGSFRRNSQMKVPEIVKIAEVFNVSPSVFSDLEEEPEAMKNIATAEMFKKLYKLNNRGLAEIEHLIDILLKANEFRRPDDA